jgi:spermidine synthase
MFRGRPLLLLGLLVCSGACALTYQVLWLRQLSLVFGVTIHAASTVLATFMAGLALGSILAERTLMRVRVPLVGFGLAEIGIGLSALATPVALDAASSVYAAVHQSWPDSPRLLLPARLIGSFLVLLIPTTLMGMTLPLLTASTLVRGSAFGSRVSALYAANTTGAVLGAVLTGFVLIGGIGMHRTFLLAAALNLFVGLSALLLQRSVVEDVAEAGLADPAARNAASQAVVASSRLHGVIIFIVTTSGLAALALEIVWFRILLQFLPATTYAFTTMLAVVLAGLAIGGAISIRVLKTPRDWMRTLALVLMATGITALGSVIFLAWSYGAGWRTSALVQGSAVAILPAAVLMGVAFPIALRLGAIHDTADLASGARVARGIGRLYAWNVAGAIAGALLGGFVLLPMLGSRRSLLLLAGLYVVSGVVVVLARPRPRRLAPAVLGAVALFIWAAGHVPDPFRAAMTRRHGQHFRELWRDEGAQTAVSVHARGTGRSLFLDGLHQASDAPDMVRVHRTIGHLPMVLHPDPRNVLVVGLGGGATAGAVTQHLQAQVRIVELSDSVRRAAPYFAHISYNVLTQPNVQLRVDDGRNFLSVTRERFDVITADIIQPIHAGAGSLYSREYFALARRALEDDGVLLQWVGHREPQHYKLIMRTFLDVFPYATLWVDGTLLVGTLTPLEVELEAFESRLAQPATRDALREVGLDSKEALVSLYTAGPEAMRAFVNGGPILTDDRPLLEYHRSLPDDASALDLSSLRGNPSEVFTP